MPIIVCITCGKNKDVKKSRADKTKYCSLKCRKTSYEKECEWCKCKIKVTPSMIKKGEGKYCSPDCYRKDKKKRTTYQRICEVCSSKFEIYLYRVKRGNVRFCSDECKYDFMQGEDHPKYARLEATCEWCGEKYTDHPNKIINGRKFCSLQCNGSYGVSIQKGRRSSIEVKVEKEIKKIGFDYEAQKRIGRYLVDFYIPHLNLVIECDGNYWHSLPKTRERDKHKDRWLKKNGYFIIRLSESEINQDPLEALHRKLPSLQLSLF